MKQRGKTSGGIISGLLLVGLMLLGACGENTATVPPTNAPAVATTVAATTAPAVTTAATTTSAATATVATTAASRTTPATTPATTSAPATTKAGTAQPTPAAGSGGVNDDPNATVTPPPLGVSESILKATGFSGDSAKTFLKDLSALGPRQVNTEGEKKAADWLESKYRAFGYSQLERQPFPISFRDNTTGTGYNIIATRPGPKPDAPLLIFGGHYDTVANTVGASDNGSGTVTTLELARVLFKRFPDHELRFINFSGEEIGLVGSSYYARKLLPADRNRLVAFINIDAVGVGDRFVTVGTPELVNQVVDLATKNGIRLEPFSLNGTGADSDQTSFTRNNLKAVALLRWIDPQLHRPGDVPERVYPEALLQVGGVAILLAQKLTGGQ